jgi:transposase
MPRLYRTAILDHRGLVAGMYDALSIGDGLDRTTQHAPETRVVTVGHAVNATVLKGLGVVHPQRSLVPRSFQHTPTQRLVARGLEAQHLHDETLGRALDTLDAAGLTELSRLMAVTAAQRLGLTPTFAYLDRTSFPVDGRNNRGEKPDTQLMHVTRGDSRDQRPDLNHVRLDGMVEHDAGIPVLMKPLRGHTSDTRHVGQVVTELVRPLQTTARTTYLVADSALDRAENRQKLADTGTTWMTRVPATLTEAPHALEPATPKAR